MIRFPRSRLAGRSCSCILKKARTLVNQAIHIKYYVSSLGLLAGSSALILQLAKCVTYGSQSTFFQRVALASDESDVTAIIGRLLAVVLKFHAIST